MAIEDELWPEKLVQLLKKVAVGNLKCLDESYFDKLCSLISKELDTGVSSECTKIILTWIEDNQSNYQSCIKNPTVAAFILRLIGIIVKRSVLCLESILDSGVISFLSSDLVNSGSSALRHNYIATLCDVASHEKGKKWIIDGEKWKEALKLATSDKSLYVQRQATELIRLLLKSETYNSTFTLQVLQSLINPIQTHLQQKNEMDNGTNLGNVLSPYLRLIDSICEDSIDVDCRNLVPVILMEKFQFDDVLKNFLDEQNPDPSMVSTYATVLLTSLPSAESSNDDEPNVNKIREMFKVLVRNGQISLLLRMSRICHILWLKLRVRRKDSSGKTEMHFFITMLLPLLVSLRKCAHSKLLDNYVSKLLDMATEETFRFGYMARDAIRADPTIITSENAVAAIHGLMDYHHQLDHEKTVLLFQTLVWVLKNFVPTTCDLDQDPADSEIAEARHLCVSLNPLLNAVLNALCTITEECKVMWSEAFEGLCILMLCHGLLTNPELPPKTTILTLRMTRLAIAQFMPPNLALVVDDVKGTSIEAIGPILMHKLHDPHWEVRDSTLEVITVIADLSLIKFPVFQEFLLDLKCYPLIVSILEGDCESYVRASALLAIHSIVPAAKVWDTCLCNLEVPKLVLGILRTDTEGIVRREAALLMARMYQFHRIPTLLLEETFETLLKVVSNDLHWEVKVNALDFWASVIDNRLQEQGMVDGVFPPVTFSKENKKITSLTESEIKIRLSKVLEELSKLGCLNALLKALHDDCDSAVVQKSTKVTRHFMKMLRLYSFIPIQKEDGRKRMCSFNLDSKREKVLSNCVSNSSEHCQVGQLSSVDVIEDIVNATDMKLLADVYVGTEQRNGCCCKEVIEMVDVDSFLTHVEEIDFGEAAEGGEGLVGLDDLPSLLDAVLSISDGKQDSNVPDCY